jgi:hypothetical protein
LWVSRQCPLAGLFDESNGFGKVLGAGRRIGITVDRPADVHGDDVGAVFGQSDGMTEALPAAGPVTRATLPFTRPVIALHHPLVSHCRFRRTVVKQGAAFGVTCRA